MSHINNKKEKDLAFHLISKNLTNYRWQLTKKEINDIIDQASNSSAWLDWPINSSFTMALIEAMNQSDDLDPNDIWL